MPRRVITTATYKGDAREIFKTALEPGEAEGASKGFAAFTGMPDHALREGDTYTLDVTTLRVFKTKGYVIHMARVDPQACVFVSLEHGGAIKSWVHHMSIVQNADMAVWTDDVIIDGGLMTPLAARIGANMYRHRHNRRRAFSIESAITPAPPVADTRLKTKRLVLRPVTLEDAGIINRYINDPRIYENVATISPGQRLKDTRRWIETLVPRRRANLLLNFAITLDGIFIGEIGLSRKSVSEPYSLGYWMAPLYWGHGYATEAGRAVLSHLTQSWGENRFRAGYLKDNPASGRVLEKLGFQKTDDGEIFCAGLGRLMDSVDMECRL